jgi:hypothetical protein
MTPTNGSAETERARGVDALYAVGHALLANGRAQEAGDVFRMMVLAAPACERSWVGLGTCHEALGQLRIAREVYGTGRLVAKPAGRCEIALARILRRTEAPDEQIEEAILRAAEIAESTDDEELRELVAYERRRGA